MNRWKDGQMDEWREEGKVRSKEWGEIGRRESIGMNNRDCQYRLSVGSGVRGIRKCTLIFNFHTLLHCLDFR